MDFAPSARATDPIPRVHAFIEPEIDPAEAHRGVVTRLEPMKHGAQR